MKLFETVEENSYNWSLFYDINNITVAEEEKVMEKQVGDIKITKLLATGYGLNLSDENRLFDRCKSVRIFTKEIELALLSGDKQMYHYANTTEGEDVDIKEIDIVEKYIYVTPKEVCSPVYIQNGEPYMNECFVNLKEYVLTHGTEKCDYGMYYDDETREFSITRGDKEYLNMKNTGIEMTYPFVIYVLRKLADREEDAGYEDNLLVTRIQLKTATGQKKL